MRIRTFILLMTLLAIAVFAAFNWNAFMTPTPLTLGVIDFQAPLGLVMLILIALLTGLFLAFVVAMQTGVLLESRRVSRELQASRTLAEQAEASRYSELRAHLDSELLKIGARLDRMDGELKTVIEEHSNSLAAVIGEMDDRLRNR